MGTHGLQTVIEQAPEVLAPYLPRITIDWLRTSPAERHRSVEGTMAFVDVSGFTAMSERLAPRGRLGAEEVTDVMSATFARLLGVAYENGGGLVKLGGDAMLLFFDGDDHARRACSAAWGMRDSLRALGPLATSAGAVELEMHVGVHTDEFDFFLVGSHHRELIVAGPAALQTVEMEEIASAGEIAVSDRAAAWLGPAELGARKGSSTLLAAPPAVAMTGIPPVPDASGLDLLSCIPAPLRHHVVEEQLESEHRHAAVAFVRFSGVQRCLRERGTIGLAEAVAEVVDVLQDACAMHGACFLESDIDGVGGRVVLVAGVPTTSGGDEERLLRTARAALDARTRLPLHIGVGAGNVFAGRVGPVYRRAYTILGGTAALAARLMAKAEAGGLWTTPDLVARSNTSFATTPVGALALKGRQEPVDVVSIGDVGEARAPGTRRRLPLVDRQRELPVLDAALAPVKLGFGSFVELIGDPGIGKSRIVEELHARAGGIPMVAAACEQYEATSPYFAFRKLIGPLLGTQLGADRTENSVALSHRLEEIDPELIPWLPLVADVLDAPVVATQETDDLQPSFRRARLNGVVEALLGRLLDTTTLILIEDVHWMDEASSDLLRHLGARVASKPWLICSTRRPVAGGFVAADGTPPVPALSLRLDPLPEADAHALAAAAAETPLSAEELAAITGRAGGNPLFVQELVAARRSSGGPVALPETVEAVLAARIDRLPPADRALLRWASVLGPSFAGDLVARVLESDDDARLDAESWDRLAEFVERDPYVAGAFHFRHALIRDAAYEALSFRRRRELHARVAEAIRASGADGDEATEMLSLHFSRAERFSDAWHYSLRAANRAAAKFANADAAELYRRALDAARAVPALARQDVGAAWEALGDVLQLSGDYGEAHVAYRNARTQFAGDADALCRMYLKEGRLHENEGQYSAALRWYSRGLRTAESLPPPTRTLHTLKLSLGYAAARFRQGSMKDCIAWCERVVESAQAAGDLEQRAHANYLLHLAYTSMGSPERARVRDLALPTYEELGDLLGQANALNNLGIEAYYEGRWDEALAYYERSRVARERIGDVVGAATIANNIAEIYSDQGRLDEAEALLRDVHATCEAAGSRLMSAVARGNLGRAAARAGRDEEARELLTAALAGLEEIEASSFVFETRVRLAEAAMLAGDTRRALATADAASADEAASTPAAQALLHRVRAYAHVQHGARAEADAELARSMQIATESDALYELALTLRARADTGLGDGGDAQAIFDRLGVVALPRVPLPAR